MAVFLVKAFFLVHRWPFAHGILSLQRERKLSHVSPYKATNPITKPPPSCLNYLPKHQLWISSHRGLGFQHTNLGGGAEYKRAVHSACWLNFTLIFECCLPKTVKALLSCCFLPVPHSQLFTSHYLEWASAANGSRAAQQCGTHTQSTCPSVFSGKPQSVLLRAAIRVWVASLLTGPGTW